MYKQNSEFKSIQKKLVAAVAMVLVAAIMVVSSSYAWFTLSTAPEVTGIKTSVGSNGNLEMALIDSTLGAITTSTDGLDFPDANNYWGNLVDVSDSGYGLSKISLAPARLNYVSGAVDSEIYLKTAEYGTDGRVSQILANTIFGRYDANESAFLQNNGFGVRVVGTSSGLSPAMQALNDARALVRNARNTAVSRAQASMRVDAVNLANILVAAKLNNIDTVSKNDFENVVDAVDNLQAIVDTLDEALRAVVVAVGVSQGETFDADDVTVAASGITVTGADLDWTSAQYLVDLAAALKEAAGVLAGMNSELGAAKGYLDDAEAGGDGRYPYGPVENAMRSLLSTADMKLGDKSLTEVTETDLMAAYIGDGLNFTIVQGIYYDIALFTDNYNTGAQPVKMILDLSSMKGDPTYGSLIPEDGMFELDMTMATEATAPASIDTFYLAYFTNVMSTLKPSDSEEDDGSTTATTITDYYAYAIDLAFRTNAPESDLLLQTDEASRVGDSTADGVQGAGSYMEFTINESNGYTLSQMVGLMDAIYVVLMDFNTNEIYGVAKLDMSATQVGETGKADEIADPATYDYIDSTSTAWKLTDATVTDGKTVKAYLYMYDVTFNESGVAQIGEKKDSSAIVALQQNVAIGITALVYLDGDRVENADVAINGNSMTGTMNLQFASSAELTPMDYDFENGEDEDDNETPTPTPTLTTPAAELNGTELTLNEVEDATSYTIAVDGEVKLTVQAADISNPVELSAYLTGDSHEIVVVAFGADDTFSAPQTITYTA